MQWFSWCRLFVQASTFVNKLFLNTMCKKTKFQYFQSTFLYFESFSHTLAQLELIQESTHTGGMKKLVFLGWDFWGLVQALKLQNPHLFENRRQQSTWIMDDQIMQFLVGGASVKTCLFNSVRAKLVLKLASSKVKYKLHLYLIPS